MGMHEAGWREKNEERATEEWRGEMKNKLATMRQCIDELGTAIDTANVNDLGAMIHAALLMEMEAADDLWKMRHGPENPDT